MDSSKALKTDAELKTPLSSGRLRALAREAGFDLCGFARVEPIPAETLEGWIRAGFAADMDWIGRRTAERLDVRELLPSAQTVMALACNYFVDDAETEASPIARYARGRDYHATLRDRLRHLRRLLAEAWPTLETYGSIDHGPVMEKVWAARAGLGYVGKSGVLITREFGSWVFLAVLILGAPVDAYVEAPEPDRCGKCNLCISACPTDAIRDERQVDAGRCLSYQTIENGESVPVELRFAFENIVFGCEICQTVCPLNDAPIQAHGDRFHPREVAKLNVRELAAMTPEQYQALVPGSALARAKYDGLRRNAAYAIGALRDVEGRAVLEQLASDPAEKVREAAKWALGELGR